MENEITGKRGLILILVILTVIIFIGLVWLIYAYQPWTLLGTRNPNTPVTTTWVENNCTYPVAYWREHPELYPSELVLGSRVYKRTEIGAALTGDAQDLPAGLQAQLIGAYLNISAGADQSLINNTVFQAYGWIVAHPAGSQLTDGEREAGSRFSTVLEAYNLGLAGVAACADGVVTAGNETATSTMTPTASPTSLPSETSTITPTVTATSTLQPTYSVWTPPVSTPTRTPTTQAPGGPPPDTWTPAPSNTPIPTTQAPTFTTAPTTEVPPPSETPTQEPTWPTPP